MVIRSEKTSDLYVPPPLSLLLQLLQYLLQPGGDALLVLLAPLLAPPALLARLAVAVQAVAVQIVAEDVEVAVHLRVLQLVYVFGLDLYVLLLLLQLRSLKGGFGLAGSAGTGDGVLRTLVG